MPRCSAFNARISSGCTNATPTSAAETPSAETTCRTRSATPGSSTATPLRLAISTSTTGGASRLRVHTVGLDNALDDLVAHDVLVAKAHEGDAIDGAEDVLHRQQAG